MLKLNNFQDGDYGWGALNTSTAISDVFLSFPIWWLW